MAFGLLRQTPPTRLVVSEPLPHQPAAADLADPGDDEQGKRPQNRRGVLHPSFEGTAVATRTGSSPPRRSGRRTTLPGDNRPHGEPGQDALLLRASRYVEDGKQEQKVQERPQHEGLEASPTGRVAPSVALVGSTSRRARLQGVPRRIVRRCREPNQRGTKRQTAKKLRITAGSEERWWRFYFPLRRTVFAKDFAKKFAKLDVVVSPYSAWL